MPSHRVNLACRERNLWPFVTPVLALASWGFVIALVGLKPALLGAAGLATVIALAGVLLGVRRIG